MIGNLNDLLAQVSFSHDELWWKFTAASYQGGFSPVPRVLFAQQ